MKRFDKIIFALSFIFLFLICTTSIASETANCFNNKLYFGGDLNVCRMCFKEGGGKNLYKSSAPGINPFFGISIYENLFIEAGYHYLGSTRVGVLESGNPIGGGMVVPHGLSPITYKSSYIIKGPHLGLVFHTPYQSEKLPFQLFFGAGLSHSTATFKRDTVQLSHHVGIVKRVFQKTRTLKRLTAGLNYKISDDTSLRFNVVVINTEKLIAHGSDGKAYFTSGPEILPKNAICYGVGFRKEF